MEKGQHQALHPLGNPASIATLAFKHMEISAGLLVLNSGGVFWRRAALEA
jgi:hypothetical protein